MLNRLSEPRSSLAVDEFHILSLYVLKKLLFQVKWETSLGTCQPLASSSERVREHIRMKSSDKLMCEMLSIDFSKHVKKYISISLYLEQIIH
jgi:hypothetical protein